jgi:hypothetical protein
MDAELEQRSKSRVLDGIQEAGGTGGDSSTEATLHREVAEDAHVLSNLLQSLEASAGEAGPVPNMLKGMGSKTPKV